MKPRHGGFTLIELMVAMGVTMVIAVVGFSLVDGMVDVWKKADRNVSMEADVNAALDLMVSDLEEAIMREGVGRMFCVTSLSYNGEPEEYDVAGTWEPATATPRPGAGEAFDPANHVYGWAGVRLRFFSAEPGCNAVAYQIVRREFVGADSFRGYHLYRSVVRSDHTIEAGLDLDAVAYSESGSSLYGNPGEIHTPSQESTLLSNVIDFGVRLYIYDMDAEDGSASGVPSGMRMIFPADDFNALDNTDTGHYGETDFGTDLDSRYPHAVELVLRVIDEDGAELLHDLEESGGTDAQWQAIVDEHSRLYRRFVDIRGRSI